MNKKFINLTYVLIFLIILSIVYIPVNAESENNTQQGFTSHQVTDIAGNGTVTDAAYLPYDAPEINAHAAIVMDLDTGDILYEKNPHERMYPASITKVLTCLLAIEQGNVNDVLTVSDSVMAQVEEGSSSIGLVAGEQLTLKDALYGMMLNSGNECALSIAEYIGGSTEGFADIMNKRAKEIGCTDTHFVNPNGLHNEDHYTSCYDMALIGHIAYQYPEFKTLISSQLYTIPETNKNESRDLWQENRLIYSGNGEYYYEYCTGGKTGYTMDALATLISFAERNGRRLVCVVMRCDPTTESYLDSIKLFNFCFTKYKICKPLTDYDINRKNKIESVILEDFYNDMDHELPIYGVNQDYSFYIRSHIADSEIEKEFVYHSTPVNGTAGNILFKYNGQTLGSTSISVDIPTIIATSTDAITKKQKEPKKEEKINIFLKRVIVIFLILIIICLTIIITVKIRKFMQMRKTKRTVKYFPISKDKRRQRKE